MKELIQNRNVPDDLTEDEIRAFITLAFVLLIQRLQNMLDGKD